MSCFTFDKSRILQVIANLNADRGTRTAARRDLYEIIEVAFRAGKSAKTDQEEKQQHRPTIGALRRFKIFYDCDSIQDARHKLVALADNIIATEWKPKDVDRHGIGKLTSWNSLDGIYTGQSGTKKNQNKVTVLKESLLIPKSYLLPTVDKQVLREEYFQTVKQPECPESFSLSRSDMNEKWENTTSKMIVSKDIDALDLTGSVLSGSVQCNKLFNLLAGAHAGKLRVLTLSRCKLLPKCIVILAKSLVNRMKQLLVLRIGSNKIAQGEKVNPGDPSSAYHYDSQGIRRCSLP